MKKMKKLLSIMLLGALLTVNVIPVSAAEVQPLAAAPALTQFYVNSVTSEKGGTETIERSGSFAQVGTRLDHGGTWLEVETAPIGARQSKKHGRATGLHERKTVLCKFSGEATEIANRE